LKRIAVLGDVAPEVLLDDALNVLVGPQRLAIPRW
jgi:hypothetical protein